MVEGRIKKIKKARFALPSLVTLGSVFCAFLSMSFVFKSQALQGDERLLLLQYAAIAIIGSIVFDTFDGKVARWTKTSTKFGMELDSLSDCVSFGIAPALLIYGFALNEAGIFGLIASFIYACGALLRLARFNIEAPDEGVQTFFKGIPSPAGAACLAAIVLACIDTQIMPSTKAKRQKAISLSSSSGSSCSDRCASSLRHLSPSSCSFATSSSMACCSRSTSISNAFHDDDAPGANRAFLTPPSNVPIKKKRPKTPTKMPIIRPTKTILRRIQKTPTKMPIIRNAKTNRLRILKIRKRQKPRQKQPKQRPKTSLPTATKSHYASLKHRSMNDALFARK